MASLVYFLVSMWTLAQLTGCGTEPTPTDAAKERSSENPGTGPRSPEEDPTRENVIEYRKDGQNLALAIEDTSELPACELANNKQLVYVKNAEVFLSCEEETWQEVPMAQGEKGDKGDKGDRGDKGETVVGPIGPVGPEGPKGDTGRPAAVNEWVDPITEVRWLIGPSQTHSQLTFGGACNGAGWRIPNALEAAEAVTNGLGLAGKNLGGADHVWTSDFQVSQLDPAVSWRVYIDGAGFERAELGGAATHGVACLYEPSEDL